MKRITLCVLFLLILINISAFAIEDGCDFPEGIPAYTTHLYGTGPGELDINTLYPEFCKVFDLYVTDQVVATWTEQDFRDFIEGVLDNDPSDTSDDVFAIVWNYFCFADEDPSYPEIRYNTNPYNPVYITKIRIELFGVGDKYPLSSSATITTLYLNSTANGDMLGVLGQAFAHEFQHLCHMANKMVYDILANPTSSGVFLIEPFATLPEHMVGSYRSNSYWDYPYDASIYVNEQCDIDRKYVVFKAFMMYVYETFINNPADITDDLFYQWLRFPSPYPDQSTPNPDLLVDLSSLSQLLWSPQYDYLGGKNSGERFKNFFTNFAVAKFANAPDFGDNHLFGYPNGNTMTDLHFFQDRRNWFDDCDGVPPTPDPAGECYGVTVPSWYTPSDGCHGGPWNVRMLVPTYELTSINQDNMTTVSGMYTDPDGSKDWIDVALYGTDYIIFKAGVDFQDGQQHEFRFEMTGSTHPAQDPFYPWTEEPEIRMQAIGYSSGVEPLQLHPENIVFIEPVHAREVGSGSGEWEASITVPYYGSDIQAVVVVMTVVEDIIGQNLYPGLFEYEYSYGVYDPAGSMTWSGDVYLTSDITVPSGDVLAMEEGCYIHIADQDYSQSGIMSGSIEITVNGTLNINGTLSRPVTLRPMNPVGMGDWFGIFMPPGSGGGTITHATITNTNVGIMSYVPITVNSSAFTDNFSGIALTSVSGTIDNCYFEDNTMGIQCMIADPVVSNSTFIENGSGVYTNGNPILGQIVGETLIGGTNRFYDNTYHINNCSPTPIYAQKNYWFSPTCPSSSKFIGDVICEPPLPTDPLNPGGGGDKRIWPHDPPAGSSEGHVTPQHDVPEQFKLVNAYPNPFNPSITISYSVPTNGGFVRISIYDVRGRKLTDLVDSFQYSGIHETRWNGQDRNGITASSGIYFVKMTAGDYQDTKKIILLK